MVIWKIAMAGCSPWCGGRQNRSDLAVFNAGDVAAGPVALVQLGHRVPAGFHGNCVNANGTHQ
jgi:carotenoid cleavage dioxygenase-like enzyme